MFEVFDRRYSRADIVIRFLAMWNLSCVFIVESPVNMSRFRSQSREGHQYGRRSQAYGYHAYYRRSLRVLSFPGLCVRVVHARRMDRWRVCSIGTGKVSSVRRLGSTW